MKKIVVVLILLLLYSCSFNNKETLVLNKIGRNDDVIITKDANYDTIKLIIEEKREGNNTVITLKSWANYEIRGGLIVLKFSDLKYNDTLFSDNIMHNCDTFVRLVNDTLEIGFASKKSSVLIRKNEEITRFIFNGISGFANFDKINFKDKDNKVILVEFVAGK